MRLYRAANDDACNPDSTSFSSSREAAAAYLDNPGFGGASLWVCDVEPQNVLDLVDADDAIALIMEVTGLPHPGAIGADEWVPRIAYDLRDAGFEWVRVNESYPQESETWILVGADEPEMEEVE